MRFHLSIGCILFLFASISYAASIPQIKSEAARQNPQVLGINVKDLGAKGDGKNDDTKAFMKAIDQGAKSKVPVVIPQGRYRITKPLSITSQSIMGTEPGGWNADAIPMPTIMVDQDQGPALTMLDAASIYGIAFIYKEDMNKYPPTILLKGNGINIQNLRIQYCWDGIISDPHANTGRLNIEDVFIVSPGNTGMYISGALDIPTLSNIEVWNNLNRQGVTAFRFGYNDGLRASQLFAFNTQVGYELADAVGDEWKSGTWGNFVDCSTDAVSIAWRSSGVKAHRIGIVGGLYWAHHMFLELDNPNVEIRAINNDIQTNGAPGVTAHNTGPLSISNARFCRAFENAATPFIDLRNIKSFILSNASFSDQSPILSIGEGAKRISISNCIFEESQFPLVLDDKRAPDSIVQMSNNIGKQQ